MSYPWSKAAIGLSVTNAPEVFKGFGAGDFTNGGFPNAVELSSGQRCVFVTGMPPTYGKSDVRYVCVRSEVGLLDGTIVDRPHTLWTAQSVVYSHKLGKYQPGPAVKIVLAWQFVDHV